MTLYTPMPLELVFDGWSRPAAAGPFIDLAVKGVVMRVVPVAPGLARIERLLNAPLEYYLKPEFMPGQLVRYDAADTGSQTLVPRGLPAWDGRS